MGVSMESQVLELVVGIQQRIMESVIPLLIIPMLKLRLQDLVWIVLELLEGIRRALVVIGEFGRENETGVDLVKTRLSQRSLDRLRV